MSYDRFQKRPVQFCNVRGTPSMASGGMGHRDGVEISAIGVLYRGPLEKKYWSSSRGTKKYPYTIGYQATRWHGGHSYSMEVSEGPRGPLFSVTCEEGIACSGQTPSAPWEDILKKRHAGAKKISMRSSATGIDGPEMFGFTNPLVHRLCLELVVSARPLAGQNVVEAGRKVRNKRKDDAPMDLGSSGALAESSGKSPKKLRKVTQLIMSEDEKTTNGGHVMADTRGSRLGEKASGDGSSQEIVNDLPQSSSTGSEAKPKSMEEKNINRAAQPKYKTSIEVNANSLVGTSNDRGVLKKRMRTKGPRSARSKLVDDELADKAAHRSKASRTLASGSIKKRNLASIERKCSNAEEGLAVVAAKNKSHGSSRTGVTDVQVVDNSVSPESEEQDLANTSSTPADCGQRNIKTTPARIADTPKPDAVAVNDSPKNVSGKAKRLKIAKPEKSSPHLVARPKDAPAVSLARPEVGLSPTPHKGDNSPAVHHIMQATPGPRQNDSKKPGPVLAETEKNSPGKVRSVSSTALQNSSSSVLHPEKMQNSLDHDKCKTDVDLAQSDGVLSIDLMCPSEDGIGDKDGKTSQSFGKEYTSKSQQNGVYLLLEACNLAVSEDGLGPKKTGGDADIANVIRKQNSSDTDSVVELTSADEESSPVREAPRLCEENLERSSAAQTMENTPCGRNHANRLRNLKGRDAHQDIRDSFGVFYSVVLSHTAKKSPTRIENAGSEGSHSTARATQPDPDLKGYSAPLTDSHENGSRRKHTKSVPPSVIESSGSHIAFFQSVPSGSVSELRSAQIVPQAELRTGSDGCLSASELREKSVAHLQSFAGGLGENLINPEVGETHEGNKNERIGDFNGNTVESQLLPEGTSQVSMNQLSTTENVTGTDGQNIDSAAEVDLSSSPKTIEKAVEGSEPPTLSAPVEAAMPTNPRELAKENRVVGLNSVSEFPPRASLAVLVGDKANPLNESTADDFPSKTGDANAPKIESATPPFSEGPSKVGLSTTAIQLKAAGAEVFSLATGVSERDSGENDATDDAMDVTEAEKPQVRSQVRADLEEMKAVDQGENAGLGLVPEMTPVEEDASETVFMEENNLLHAMERSENPSWEGHLDIPVSSAEEDEAGVAMSFGKVMEDGVVTVLSPDRQVDLFTDTLQEDHDDICTKSNAAEFVPLMAVHENQLSTASVFGYVLENGVVTAMPPDYYRDLQADTVPCLGLNDAPQVDELMTCYGVNPAKTLQACTGTGISPKRSNEFVNSEDDELVAAVKDIEPDREVSVGKIIDHGVVTVLDVGHQVGSFVDTVPAEESLTQTFCKDDLSKTIGKEIEGGHHEPSDELQGGHTGGEENETRLPSLGLRVFSGNTKTAAGLLQAAVRGRQDQRSLHTEHYMKRLTDLCTEKEQTPTGLGLKHECEENSVGADTCPKDGLKTPASCLDSSNENARQVIATGNLEREQDVATVATVLATNCNDSAIVTGDANSDVGFRGATLLPVQELAMAAKSTRRAEEIQEDVFSDLAAVAPMITSVISGAVEEPTSHETKTMHLQIASEAPCKVQPTALAQEQSLEQKRSVNSQVTKAKNTHVLHHRVRLMNTGFTCEESYPSGKPNDAELKEEKDLSRESGARDVSLSRQAKDSADIELEHNVVRVLPYTLRNSHVFVAPVGHPVGVVEEPSLISNAAANVGKRVEDGIVNGGGQHSGNLLDYEGLLFKVKQMGDVDTMESLLCIDHPLPVLAMVLNVRGDEVRLCVVCGITGAEDRSLFLYQIAYKEDDGINPQLLCTATLTCTKSFYSAKPIQISLEETALRFSPDGHQLLLLDCYKLPKSCRSSVEDDDRHGVTVVTFKNVLETSIHLQSDERMQCLAVPGPLLLIAAGDRGSIKCWEMDVGWRTCRAKFSLPRAMHNGFPFTSITKLAVIPGSTHLVLGCDYSGSFALWDTRNRTLLSSLHLPNYNVLKASWLDIATNRVELSQNWEVLQPKIRSQEIENTDPMLGRLNMLVAMVCRGRSTITDNAGVVKYDNMREEATEWSCETMTLSSAGMICGPSLPDKAMAVTSLGLYGVMGTSRGVVRLWDVTTGKTFDLNELHGSPIVSLATNPSSSVLAAADANGHVVLYAEKDSAICMRSCSTK